MGPDTVAQIDARLSGQRDALGSVEGTLEIISIHERVCIRGRVHYRQDGVPATVDAYWLRVLCPLPQLPSIEAMIGCASTT